MIERGLDGFGGFSRIFFCIPRSEIYQHSLNLSQLHTFKSIQILTPGVPYHLPSSEFNRGIYPNLKFKIQNLKLTSSTVPNKMHIRRFWLPKAFDGIDKTQHHILLQSIRLYFLDIIQVGGPTDPLVFIQHIEDR